VTTKSAEAVESTTNSAIGKAFAVLQALRDAPGPMTLTAIADNVGIAPSSAHSILSHLLGVSAVVQVQDKRYQLGPQLFYMGAAFARGQAIYRSVWMELINAAAEYRVTAAIAVPWKDHHLVLNSHRSGGSEVAIPFGGRVPLDAASWGKVYYAWSGDKVPDKLVAYTSASITDRKAFVAELEAVRRDGYAVDRGEFFDGVGGVGAPVTSVNGYEGLACFVAPLEQMDEIGASVLGRRIATLTARASLSLGDSDRIRFYGVE
jgi:DNA-binding IclR family transcriptional regulator